MSEQLNLPISVDEIISRNKIAGYKHFSDGAMRSFGTRVQQNIYPSHLEKGVYYFVTSEKGCTVTAPRTFSTHRLCFNGDVKTIETKLGRYGAHRLARGIARGYKVYGVCDPYQPRDNNVALIEAPASIFRSRGY